MTVTRGLPFFIVGRSGVGSATLLGSVSPVGCCVLPGTGGGALSFRCLGDGVVPLLVGRLGV